jgi:hypothetical protein
MSRSDGVAQKRTYTLSSDIVHRFEGLVPTGERSPMVERLLREEIEQIERARLEELIAKGLADMADVYAETATEWQIVDRESWPKE